MTVTEISPLLQGLDLMPDGICFYLDDKPVFINAKMKRIMNLAFTSGESDVSVFGRLREAELKDGCSTVKDGISTFLLLSDGSAWRIKTGKITVKNTVYDEYTAYDVTELYGKSLELKKRNEHIAKTNEKIRQYSNSMDSIIRDRELLDAKIRIHDDVGRALLSLRSYLYREDKDRDALVDLWRVTVSVLRRETFPDVSDDRMEALSDAARAVDVALHYDGEITDDPVIKDISVTAIRECLTNTVKHADGHNLYIKTRYKNGVYTVSIKNDGKQPDKPVVETGGLHTLRSAVERCGGKMTVLQKDGFELKILLYHCGKG